MHYIKRLCTHLSLALWRYFAYLQAELVCRTVKQICSMDVLQWFREKPSLIVLNTAEGSTMLHRPLATWLAALTECSRR